MDLVFMGSPDFSVPALNRIAENEKLTIKGVVTQPDRPRGRGQKMEPTVVKKRALQLGLNVLTSQDVNQPGFVKKLQELAPEVIVVVAFGQILSREILDIPEIGCINLHASLLPKYRGASPIHRAIINGEQESGATIMFMDEGMDTGDIIEQQKTPIAEDDTVGDLHDRLASMGADLLVKTLLDIKKGDYTRKKQDDSAATYADKLKKETGKIDWSEDAEDIYNLVRGLNPWPTAYTFYDDQRLKIWETEIFSKQEVKGEPGEIIQASREGLLVQAGRGIIKIITLQPPGKSKMNYKDFLNGYQVEQGGRLM
ncbi:MAG: methionyl-tRNA formyltransferase [Bacillota bacterium]